MLKNVSSEGGLPRGRNLASATGLRGSSAGLAAHDSSWLGLLSVLSRPALSFVSKYLPGLVGGGGASTGPEWQPGVGRADVAQEQDELCAPWLSDSEHSLRQLEIEPGRNPEASPSGTFFAWDVQKDGMKGRWSGFQEGNPQSAPWSHAELGSVHKHLGVLQSSQLTKEQCRILVSGDRLVKNAVGVIHKQQASVNAGPEGAPNGGDQDNGYYSLEEEHGLKRHACLSVSVKLSDVPGRVLWDGLPDKTAGEMEAGRAPEEGPPFKMATESRETADDGHAWQSAAALCEAHVKLPDGTDSPSQAADKTEVDRLARTAVPQCRNASIAFIMGCPHGGGEDDSQSDADSAQDDGFDSSGSSDLSSDRLSSDEDGGVGDVADEEAGRLLASVCHHDDPCNPPNVSAWLHTACAEPCSIPATTASPASGQDVWDDSGGEADEADEAESLLLLASMTPSDPYSLLNFQAPLSTGKAPALPPRMDSGLVRPFTQAKKVRFSDVVEEFLIASGANAAEEDRRGPWEQLARDRGRFLRRCREAELTLAYCLQPEHRRRVYCRITGHHAE
ncbi:protein phosphatase 1 regulatory subunit 15B [Syngnathus acus]|uniref:protein phosphatase 1 regulatory subunit 15B n=1 Tax=Syngnathus acus TaxID=161584 RepID=UPI0018864424|nr:protein phosphatase 1 regulatory subunit 15B [Syngnathus acus]